MNAEIFVQNVSDLSKKIGVSKTTACVESGVGRSFLNDIKRGQTPSVAKVQLLAAYLGVTTSELLGEVSPGETKKPTPEIRDGPGEVVSAQDLALFRLFHELNEEGREKLLDTADDLVRTGKYIKLNSPRMGKKA